MYKLIIVDDDEILLRGLTDKIEWEKLGIKMIASYDNGKSALDALIKYKADILLTDIKMPMMDGIELIGHVKKYNQDISVIIISAHDEFEYAHEAIKKGADGYLLKPINLDYLRELMLKIVKDKEYQKSINAKIKKVSYLQEEKKNNDKFRMYYDLLFETMSEDEFASNYSNNIPSEEYKVFSTTVIKYKNVTKDDEFILLQNLGDQAVNIAEIGRFEKISVLNIYRKLIIIACAKNHEELSDMLEIMKAKLRSYTDILGSEIKVVFQNGQVVDEFYKLGISYQSALQLDDLYYANYGKSELYSVDLLNDYDEDVECIESAEKIAEITLLGDKKTLNQELENYEILIKKQGKKAKMIFSHTLSIIFSYLEHECDTVSIELNNVVGETVIILDEIISEETLKEGIKSLSNKLYLIIDYINTQSDKSNKQLMINAYRYIDIHYINPDLRLIDIAEHVGLSKNYFSKVFKTITQKSFTDYLIDYRMEKAHKLLINTDYRGYEVSYMVGYNNPTYFSSTFKKYSGFSPSEFKKMHK